MARGFRTYGTWLVAVVGLLSVAGCNLGEPIRPFNPNFHSKESAVDCGPSDPNALVFAQAVCLCGDFGEIGNTLTTESFSSLGSNQDTAHLGHVGINGKLGQIGNMGIDGTLDVKSAVGSVGNLRVFVDLHTGANFGGIGRYVVDQNAYVGGDVVGIGYMKVGGALNVTGDIKNLGVLKCDRINEGPLYVPHDPCACADNQIINVAAEVAARRTAKLLNIPSGIGHQEFTVVAGDYYVPAGQQFIGNSVMKIEGAVRIFVEGDLERIGNSMIKLADTAELDLYVAGSVRKIGNIMSKGEAASRNFRLYIGGTGEASFDLIGNTIFRGSIYAPRADVRFIGNMMVKGSIFARNLKGIGNLMVSFDTGLQGIGEDCDQDQVDNDPVDPIDDDPVDENPIDDDSDDNTDPNDNPDGDCPSGDDACP